MTKMESILKLVFVCAYSSFVNGTYLYEQMGALLNDLKTEYNKDVLPVQNKSSVLHVELFLSVFSVPDIDSVKGVLTLQVTGLCRWKDQRMTWKPEVYGNVSRVWIPKENVWKPTLAVSSSIDYSPLSGVDTKVQYKYDGLATWKPENMMTISCKFYMKYWPFDKQLCLVVISVMDYSSSQVQLTSIETGISTYYVQMMEWTLEESCVEKGLYEETSFLVYTIKLKRKHTFYLFTTILPITFIAFLQPFVFLLPSDAGERVGFSITIVLSMTVYFTIISDQIPRTAEPMALICGYVMLLTISSVVITILVILNLRLRHSRNTKPVGKWLHKKHKLWFCSSRIKVTRSVVNENTTDIPETTNKDENISSSDDRDNRHNINLEGKEIDNVVTNNEDTDVDSLDSTLADICETLDKTLFMFASLITIIPSVVFLLYLKIASDYNPHRIEF